MPKNLHFERHARAFLFCVFFAVFLVICECCICALKLKKREIVLESTGLVDLIFVQVLRVFLPGFCSSWSFENWVFVNLGSLSCVWDLEDLGLPSEQDKVNYFCLNF